MRTIHILGILVLLALTVPTAPAHAGGVVSVCDEAHLLAALAGGGTVTFSCSGTITLTATIAIAADTTIDGTGQAVTISGNHAVRVFTVNEGVTLNLNEVTVAGGNSNGSAGGGIFNYGLLTVSKSTFSDNSAPYAGGGGIYNYGTVAISNSTFFGNNAVGGGGIYNAGGTVTTNNSTFSGNSAMGGGGGMYNSGGTITLKNTIVANSPAGGNCSGDVPIIGGGGNLSYPDTTCPGINGDPLLGPLQNNGGPTDTMELGPGSAAFEAGNIATCAAAPVNSIDQRGITRPQGARCDIGAVEHLLPFREWFPAARAR